MGLSGFVVLIWTCVTDGMRTDGEVLSDRICAAAVELFDKEKWTKFWKGGGLWIPKKIFQTGEKMIEPSPPQLACVDPPAPRHQTVDPVKCIRANL
jgi:hypothetical protein